MPPFIEAFFGLGTGQRAACKAQCPSDIHGVQIPIPTRDTRAIDVDAFSRVLMCSHSLSRLIMGRKKVGEGWCLGMERR